jgi:hypothetical protein
MVDTNSVDDDQISVDGIEEAETARPPRSYPQSDPDEFFSKHAFRVVYQTNNFLLPQLRDLITRGDILNIRPEYQRRLRWTTLQKSRLIESLLLNIPVPPIFLYETDEARYEVRSCREVGGNWAAQGPRWHGGADQAARSRSVGERSRLGQPSTRRMVI